MGASVEFGGSGMGRGDVVVPLNRPLWGCQLLNVILWFVRVFCV